VNGYVHLMNYGSSVRVRTTLIRCQRVRGAWGRYFPMMHKIRADPPRIKGFAPLTRIRRGLGIGIEAPQKLSKRVIKMHFILLGIGRFPGPAH
jgi:hypothetical protein